MYDIAVIGGGALGTGIARDAALRGLSVALLEQDDFGVGATSRTSHLLSASLRALETLDFTRVREDLREREILLQIAPHLVAPLPCLIPFYGHGLLAQTRLRASLALMDALGFDKSLPLHQLLSPAEAREREPSLRAEGLAGAALVWEAFVPQTERLALENALDAREHGAFLQPHQRVEGLHRRPGGKGWERVSGIRWRDQITGEAGETEARLFINATGASLPELDGTLKELSGISGMRRKCVSVAAAPLRGGRDALLFPGDDGSGFLSVIPWQGLSLISSRETALSDFASGALYATGPEVAALLRPLAELLPDAGLNNPALALAGVRVSPPFPGPPALPDTHLPLLVDHAVSGGLGGLISVAGGSLLSCRSLAEEVVDLACRKLGQALSTPPCRTATTPLPGASGNNPLAVLLPGDHSPLKAAVEYAVAAEECRTLCDFMERRSSLFCTPDQGLSFLPFVRDAMAELLGWNMSRQVQEVKAWETDIALTQAFRVM